MIIHEFMGKEELNFIAHLLTEIKEIQRYCNKLLEVYLIYLMMNPHTVPETKISPVSVVKISRYGYE